MALWVCEGCGTLYAVGLFRCPRCHEEAFHEFGSRPEDEEHPMAKITVHGGPTDAVADAVAEAEAEADAGAEVAGGEPGDGTGLGSSRPRSGDLKDDWVEWAVEAGYDESYAAGLTKAALGELPDDPSEDEDYVAWVDAQTAPEDEEGEGAEDGPADGADES